MKETHQGAEEKVEWRAVANVVDAAPYWNGKALLMIQWGICSKPGMLPCRALKLWVCSFFPYQWTNMYKFDECVIGEYRKRNDKKMVSVEKQTKNLKHNFDLIMERHSQEVLF